MIPNMPIASGACLCRLIASSRNFGPRFLRQVQSGSFFLGQLRSRRDPLFRAAGAAASRRHSAFARRRHARSLFAGSEQPRFLAGQRSRCRQPIFYSYAYPEPPGFAEAKVQPGRVLQHATAANSFCPTTTCAKRRHPDEASAANLRKARTTRPPRWEMGPSRARGNETCLAFAAATLVITRDDFNPRMRSRATAPGVRVQDGWRQLYGDFDRLGVSVEWHDFQTEQSARLGPSFHPRSLEFCLNLQGRGAVGGQDDVQAIMCRAAPAITRLTDEPLAASRQRAATIINSSPWNSREKHLQKQLADCEGDLDPQMRAADFSEKRSKSIVSQPRPMSVAATQCGGDAGAAAGAESRPDLSGIKARRSSSWRIFFLRRRIRSFFACAKNGSRAIGWSGRRNCSRAIWRIRRRWRCSDRKSDAAHFI